jgi:uncharacterized membrane protein
MAVLFQILLVAHVMSAMLWFGGSTFAPRRVREALDSERTEARRHMIALTRQGWVLGMAATLVVVTGVGLALSVPGGFAVLPPRYHAALALSLVWLAIALFAVRTTGERIEAIVHSDAALDPARALAKRFGMLSGIQHLLFTSVLVLMLWRL